MSHIEELERLAVPVGPGCLVALGYLPPSGDAGLDREELVTRVTELQRLLLRDRTRADDSKVAHEHVQELRELIDGVAAKHAPDTRNAWVIVDLLLAAPEGELIGRHVALGVLMGVRGHGAELPNPDRRATQADTRLPVQRGTGRIQHDKDAQQEPRDDAEDHDHQ